MNNHPIYEAIQRLIALDHFQSFVIVLDSGEALQINHREFAFPVKGWGLVIVQRPEDAVARMINPEHVREIVRVDSAKKSA